ncbi:MAG TPA: signal peptidase II [Saprospiraceae bacterium]|nr:signal peptidase II [Saprospiraceae bacterium]
MKQTKRILILMLIAIVLIVIDRLTKEYAKEHLYNKESISYFNNVIRFEYAENTGAFLSLGDELPRSWSFWLFSIIPLLFLIGLLIYIIRESPHMRWLTLLAFIMIFAGGVGNIIDRIVNDRHVIDFMNMGIGTLRTGIFNFADLCLTTGVVLLLFTYPKKEKEQGATE